MACSIISLVICTIYFALDVLHKTVEVLHRIAVEAGLRRSAIGTDEGQGQRVRLGVLMARDPLHRRDKQAEFCRVVAQEPARVLPRLRRGWLGARPSARAHQHRIDIVRDDHAVIDGAQPTGHDNPHATSVV